MRTSVTTATVRSTGFSRNVASFRRFRLKAVLQTLTFVLLTLSCLPLHAQDDKSGDKEEKKEKPEIVAVVGGDIHTVTGPVVRKGTILIEDGKIKEIGQSVEVPDDAKVIDAAGKTVTPGFVAISMSRVGVGQAPSGKEKLVDGLNPFDRNIKYRSALESHRVALSLPLAVDVVVAEPKGLLSKCIPVSYTHLTLPTICSV